MKARPKERRQLFVLTAEEKGTLSFVLIAFLLGAATKHYRTKHSIPPVQLAIHEAAKNAGLPAQKRAEARQRKAVP